VALAVTHGVPAPGMTASLGYFDTYRRERLPANLVQVRAGSAALQWGGWRVTAAQGAEGGSSLVPPP